MYIFKTIITVLSALLAFILSAAVYFKKDEFEKKERTVAYSFSIFLVVLLVLVWC